MTKKNEIDTGDATIVEISLATSTTTAYSHAQRESDSAALEGKQADGTTNGTAHSFRIDDDHTHNIGSADLRTVKIKCSDEKEALKLRLSYEETKAHVAGDKTTELSITAGNTLNLDINDFGGLNNLDINGVTFTDGDANSTTIIANGDQGPARAELFKLDALFDTLESRYIVTSDITTDETTNIDYLKTFGSTTGGVVTDITKAIYELSDGTGNIYKNKANANGFYVDSRGSGTAANIASDLEFTTQNTTSASGDAKTTTKDFFPTSRQYLGFSILEATQTVTTATAGDDATHLFNRSATVSAKYTKKKIDKLRDLANHGSTTAPIITAVKEWGEESRTTAKDLFGFELEVRTKQEFKIMDAADKDRLLDAAFFNTDFSEVNYNYIPEINIVTRNNSLTDKISNEVGLIDRYYVAAKMNTNNIWKPKASTTTDEPLDTDTDTMEIEAAYKEMREQLVALQIDTKLAAIEVVITGTPPPADLATAIATAKTAAEILTKVTELIAAVIKANGIYDKDTLTKLRDYKTKDNDDKKADRAKKALEKLEAELTTAQNGLKAAIKDATDDTLRGELEGLVKKTEAWAAVDKHEKTTKVKASEEYNKPNSTYKTEYDGKIGPRTKVAAIVRGKKDAKSTEFSGLIIDLMRVNTTYSEEDNKAKKTELEGKLAKIKKYTEAGTEESKLYNKLSTDEQSVINVMIGEATTKLENMKKKIKDDNIPEQNSPNKGPKDDNF
ncbi:11177_t:CDS:10 [Ambispora gerdemannii]|uniref:11177_t:CDS:1 n=1 Tax=Ambispora gerdemannii TaxID=144530 RepID=A0A9N9BZI1_9GLOM|nr:11177_t:CDS:10 [Ambispora gerdemannii]